MLDDSTDETREHRRARGPALRARRASTSSTSTAPTAPATRPARSRPGCKVARGEFIAIFDADFIPTADFLTRHDAALHRPEGRHGAGALGPHQPGLLAADEDPGDPARRPLRPRARRPQPRRALLQLQRHGRHLAPRGDRRRRRLAARHADRGPRPQLPRAAARLAVRLPARRHRAGRTAGRDERLQVAAAPLGEGLDPDLPQAAAADPARRTCRSASRPRRSST